MGKPHNNKRASPKKVQLTKARIERRKAKIASRVAGQFNDLPPGQRQKLENNFHRVKRQRF